MILVLRTANPNSFRVPLCTMPLSLLAPKPLGQGALVQDRPEMVILGWRVGGSSSSSCFLGAENSSQGSRRMSGCVSKFCPQNLANPMLHPGVRRGDLTGTSNCQGLAGRGGTSHSEAGLQVSSFSPWLSVFRPRERN